MLVVGIAAGQEDEATSLILVVRYFQMTVAQSNDLEVLVAVGSEGRAKEQEAKIGQLRELLNTDEGRAAAGKLVQGGELSCPEEMTEDMYLRRWLRARKWEVEVAARCIVAHAQWRVDMMPTGKILPSEIPNELAAGKAFMLGCDKDGRAVLLIQARKHNAWGRKLEELQRFCCYILDSAVAACDTVTNPRGHIAVILDLTDMGTLNMDVQAVTALFKLLGEHYVERLGQMIMYNPPYIFWGAWNALSPMLPSVTLKKILVVSTKEQPKMIEAVGPQVLPTEYGGGAAVVAPVS